MDLLNAIRSFIKVVEAGSIAAGARTLGLSPAAVSQNLARLEAHLQVRLLSRTTRSMALTPAGTLYYEPPVHCVDLRLRSPCAGAVDPGIQCPLPAAFDRIGND